LLFVAAHTHPAAKCPLLTPEGKAMIKMLFSDENVRKSGLKIVGAYMSCPKDNSAEHSARATRPNLKVHAFVTILL
jgi:hypothetical protein